MKKNDVFFKSLNVGIVFIFLSQMIQPYSAYAQSSLILPSPTENLSVSPQFAPVMIRGMKLDLQNGLNMSLIVDSGEENLGASAMQVESEKMIKYFMTALTVPEKDLWVNLSPYEKDRITTPALAKTAMGEELLAQDYMLKKITAALIFPEDEIGKKFWNKIQQGVYEKYGVTDLPVNTFHKIWIMPDKAEVFAQNDTVVILNSRLKVMLEEDYLAKTEDAKRQDMGAVGDSVKDMDPQVKQVMRDVVIPVIEDEVNNGKNFAGLRQIYHALILAKWFKDNLKSSVLGQVYADQSKVSGVDQDNGKSLENIYNQYLAAFNAGSAGVIKESYDSATQSLIAKKYVTGGFRGDVNVSQAMMSSPQILQTLSRKVKGILNLVSFKAQPERIVSDKAMMTRKNFIQNTALFFAGLVVVPFNFNKPFLFELNLSELENDGSFVLDKNIDWSGVSGDPTLEEIVKAFQDKKYVSPQRVDLKIGTHQMAFIGGDHSLGEVTQILSICSKTQSGQPLSSEDVGTLRTTIESKAGTLRNYRDEINLIKEWDKTAQGFQPLFLERDPMGHMKSDNLRILLNSKSYLVSAGLSEDEVDQIFMLVAPYEWSMIKGVIKPRITFGVDPQSLMKKFVAVAKKVIQSMNSLASQWDNKNVELKKDALLKIEAIFSYSVNHYENLFETFKAELNIPSDLQSIYDAISQGTQELIEVIKERDIEMLSLSVGIMNLMKTNGLLVVGRAHLHQKGFLSAVNNQRVKSESVVNKGDRDMLVMALSKKLTLAKQFFGADIMTKQVASEFLTLAQSVYESMLKTEFSESLSNSKLSAEIESLRTDIGNKAMMTRRNFIENTALFSLGGVLNLESLFRNKPGDVLNLGDLDKNFSSMLGYTPTIWKRPDGIDFYAEYYLFGEKEDAWELFITSFNTFNQFLNSKKHNQLDVNDPETKNALDILSADLFPILKREDADLRLESYNSLFKTLKENKNYTDVGLEISENDSRIFLETVKNVPMMRQILRAAGFDKDQIHSLMVQAFPQGLYAISELGYLDNQGLNYISIEAENEERDFINELRGLVDQEVSVKKSAMYSKQREVLEAVAVYHKLYEDGYLFEKNFTDINGQIINYQAKFVGPEIQEAFRIFALKVYKLALVQLLRDRKINKILDAKKERGRKILYSVNYLHLVSQQYIESQKNNQNFWSQVEKNLQEVNEALGDKAMLLEDKAPTRGGIDFDSSKMDLQSSGKIDAAMMKGLLNMKPEEIGGFIPVNITITPIANVNLLFGQANQSNDEKSQEDNQVSLFVLKPEMEFA